MTDKIRTPKTTEELIGGVRRQLRAIEARGSDEDPWLAADLLAISAEAEEAVVRLVAGYRKAGLRWADIAFSLGISELTALKRYRHRIQALEPAGQEKLAALSLR